jgi:hypothetical protein
MKKGNLLIIGMYGFRALELIFLFLPSPGIAQSVDCDNQSLQDAIFAATLGSTISEVFKKENNSQLAMSEGKGRKGLCFFLFKSHFMLCFE